MKAEEINERSKKYLQQAEKKLSELGKEIDKLRSKSLKKPDVRAEDWEIKVQDLQGRLGDVKTQIDGLTRSGQQQWSDLQANVESGLWDAGAALRRLIDGARPLADPGGAATKARYFLQKTPQGRWGLLRQGARGAVKHFNSKTEALLFSRRYVRQKSPSELVVRRVDGTFEKVHSYR